MTSVVVAGLFNVDHVWRRDTACTRRNPAGPLTRASGGKRLQPATQRALWGPHYWSVPWEQMLAAHWHVNSATADGLMLHALESGQPTGTVVHLCRCAWPQQHCDWRGCQCLAGSGTRAGTGRSDQHGWRIAGATGIAVESIAAPRWPAPVACPPCSIPRQCRHHGGNQVKLADVITPNETEFATLLARHHGERLEPEQIATTDSARLHALCRGNPPHGSGDHPGSTGVFVSHPEANQRDDGNPITAWLPKPLSPSTPPVPATPSMAHGPRRWPTRQSAPSLNTYALLNRYAALSTERAGAALAMPRLEEVQERFPS